MRMDKHGHARSTAEVLSGQPIAWPKKAEHWAEYVGDAEVVYEDDHVIAFHEELDDPMESPRVPTEIRVTLVTKRLVPSLMHLGAADGALNASVLNGIQQVAYKLGLQEKGFEVRSHILPPLQHRPQLAFKIRSGKPPKPTDDAT
jgi:hypothetical protein